MAGAGILIGCLLLAGAFFLGVHTARKGSERTETASAGGSVSLFVGDVPISDYTIVRDWRGREAARYLQSLIEEVSGESLPIKTSAGNGPILTVRVVPDAETSRFWISGGDITICGNTLQSCMEQVRIFANAYLGFAFAGQEREHLLRESEIHIPKDYVLSESPWIEEREPIVCLWKTTTARGVYYDGNTSLKSELMSYSDDQLYTYVRMMRHLGFTGIQVTDMCSAWASYGSYEYVHDRLRFLADAAHSLGMKFTLWVWGAEFDGYGWVDDTVFYYDYQNYVPPRESPEANATFEKYYSIYAELADCTDRVIAHYNDPGNLGYSEDIAYFAGMLREKFRAGNPEVDFGVSCYTDAIDKAVLAETLGTDFTAYSGARTERDSNWSMFRTQTVNLGIGYGVWSWNLAEMEIDQLAEMNVNANLIQDVYLRSAGNDEIRKPDYWSEMDSYHLLNIFSLYCAGRLLQEPGTDPEQLLWEIARDVVGEEYADAFKDVLDLIQDARTGESWETFRWEQEEYLLTSDSYNAADILERSERAEEALQEMIGADLTGNRVPLPISVSDLLRLILPHIKQIGQFAGFRLDLEQAREMAENGASSEELQAFAEKIYEPIPEYNTVIGLWGQVEQRAQYLLLEEFCAENGLEVPRDGTFRYYRKRRIYEHFVMKQKSDRERGLYSKVDLQFSCAFGEDETRELVEEMIEEGILGETADGLVYLPDWENYRYNF